MEKKEFLVLGKPVRHPITEPDTVPCPPTVTRVVMTSDEVTALCPITGQPDYYTVTIAFEPRGWSIESKSLKLYLWHFREEGIFCESLADKIAEDVFRTIRPAWCEVTVVQKARGGDHHHRCGPAGGPAPLARQRSASPVAPPAAGRTAPGGKPCARIRRSPRSPSRCSWGFSWRAW
jgi:7-cyano-7-deazaguanine reductase